MQMWCESSRITVGDAPVSCGHLQELPDNDLYCPPITIRCVDCRNFGRFVLVGTHVIDNMRKFMYVPTTKTAKEAIKKFLGAGRPITSTLRHSALCEIVVNPLCTMSSLCKPFITFVISLLFLCVLAF